MFGEGFARRLARRYRRRGLDPTATWMVDFLATGGVDGATVLEVGGGVGEIGIELARRGAASVLTVELSGAYDEAAARLANEAGVADRMHRRLVDIAVDAAPEADAPRSVEPADVVVLHRVVCCYPDYDRLLGAAARLCRDRLVFSHPARHLGTRAVVVAENVLVQIEHLRTQPAVAAALSRGTLRLHAWVYTIETGEVYAYDPVDGQYERLEGKLVPVAEKRNTIRPWS